MKRFKLIVGSVQDACLATVDAFNSGVNIIPEVVVCVGKTGKATMHWLWVYVLLLLLYVQVKSILSAHQEVVEWAKLIYQAVCDMMM